MNLDRLKQAETEFLDRYPGGFNNLEIVAIRTRRHNVDKMIAFAQESFGQENFKLTPLIIQNMMKLISRSSIISRYEKPGFRDFVQSLSNEEQSWLIEAWKELLHGNETQGFEALADLLRRAQLAKWSLMTACQAYFHPQRDVLVKPTTVKSIIVFFELDHLKYSPRPTWDFYEAYRSALWEMKSKVNTSLSPSNIAFSWFLLLSSRRDVLQGYSS